MADLNGFDATTIEPQREFEPIPAGKYEAVITDSDMRESKAGSSYLWLQFQIIEEGEFKNRNQWARLNIRHPNEKVRQIAMGELSAICRACGVLTPKDSSELHDIPLVITVKCRKRDDTGEIANEIRGYSPAGEGGEPSPGEMARAAAKPVDDKVAPWKRGTAARR
jgi:hypothetical protein